MRSDPLGSPRPELLISICNKAVDPQPTCLLRMDAVTQHYEWVDIGLGGDRAVSGVGICGDESRIFHLSAIETTLATRLSVLDRATLQVLAVQSLPEIQDPHSICRRGDEVFIASTGTDEVISYQLVGNELANPRTYWSPTNSRADTHHINSVAVADGDILCSAFGGGGAETSWRTTTEGYIYNIDRDAVVKDGLGQPHTVCPYRDELLFCNSRTGTVETTTTILAYLAGYSRGLAVGPSTIYAGSSFARRSKTAGDVFLNPSDEGPLRSRCALVQLPTDEDLRVEVGMTGLGYEIYDILVR